MIYTFEAYEPYYTLIGGFIDTLLVSYLLSQGSGPLISICDQVKIPPFSSQIEFNQYCEYHTNLKPIELLSYRFNNFNEDFMACLNSFRPGWQSDDDFFEDLPMRGKVYFNHPDCLYAYINYVQLSQGFKNFVIQA